ncbi:MAG: PAS domain-containing sensor histidine kinase [Bryobacteraceae bacterium]
MRIPMPEQERPTAEVFLDQAPACQWIVNRDGVFEQIFGDTMPLFGKPTAEVTGQPAASVMKPADLPLWQERFSRAFAGESFMLRERQDERVWCIAVFPLHLRAGAVHAGCVARDITDLGPGAVHSGCVVRDSADLIRANRELRGTVLGALKSQDAQRARTARFLHNVVGQNLAALGLRLDLVRMDLGGSTPAACDRLGEIQALLESVMEQVRNFSYELNPSAVERVGLRSALERLAGHLREQFHGTVLVDVDSSIVFQPSAAMALYRIADEAAQNAARHSGCSSLEIVVKPASGGAWMEVRDDGHGFEPVDLQEMSSGLGLLTMEHQAAGAGLNLSISSSRLSGTVVRVAVPIPEGGQLC